MFVKSGKLGLGYPQLGPPQEGFAVSRDSLLTKKLSESIKRTSEQRNTTGGPRNGSSSLLTGPGTRSNNPLSAGVGIVSRGAALLPVRGDCRSAGAIYSHQTGVAEGPASSDVETLSVPFFVFREAKYLYGYVGDI